MWGCNLLLIPEFKKGQKRETLPFLGYCWITHAFEMDWQHFLNHLPFPFNSPLWSAAGISTSYSGLHLSEQILCSLIPPPPTPTNATTEIFAQCFSEYSLSFYSHLWICLHWHSSKYGKHLQLKNKNKQLAAFPHKHLGKRRFKSTSLYEYDSPNTRHKFPPLVTRTLYITDTGTIQQSIAIIKLCYIFLKHYLL